MKDKRLDIVKVFSQVSPDKTLVDLRLHRNFCKFGKVSDVARQYGIEIRPVDGGIEFSAPKSRMQMFVEKLHFSQVGYREVL